jgi:hypothetical protein
MMLNLGISAEQQDVLMGDAVRRGQQISEAEMVALATSGLPPKGDVT